MEWTNSTRRGEARRDEGRGGGSGWLHAGASNYDKGGMDNKLYEIS